MALEFVYAQPVKIFFGAGQYARLGETVRESGLRRCVVVCGRHFAAEAETLMHRDDAFRAAYSAVEENPQLSGVEAVVSLAREYDADGIVGIGGGSAIDTAKFAAAIALGDAPAEEYFYGRREFPSQRLAILAVPTTAGTGSEVTQVSVVSRGHEKRTINHPAFMPRAAIVDPELSVTVPPRTTVNTGLDAMAHALEGYWSRSHQPISDLMAVEAVRLVLENLEAAYRDGRNAAAREKMAYAALLGGLSFALPKTAGCHACSYPLSEDYGLSHGEACAFTLPSFVRINADERLEKLSHAAGLRDTEELARRIEAFRDLAGLRTRLSDLGAVDIDKLCRDCAAHPLMNNNPVRMDEDALRAMFEALR